MVKNKFNLIILLGLLLLVSCAKEELVRNFITRDGYLLKDGDSTFRFLSFNIPNINFIEDEMEFTKVHPYRLPTSFEIRDAFESVKQMGGTVVRAYTFPVKRKTDTLDIPRYVNGPGKFDESSFKIMDSVLAIANDEGIRLIMPLLNNWKWMGGVPQYAGFRGKSEFEFWTDSILIQDFKATINYVLNRVNSVTGLKYKNDKSILCWETGNELSSPYSWTKEITSYIKSIDSNHLVMDGFNAIDGFDIHEESLTDSLIDIVTTHHYKLNPIEIIKDISTQVLKINKRKPYIVGEFGFLGTAAIEQISDFIISNENISGGLIWSLRSHRNEGGFYWHSEPYGGDVFKAFHYPGFVSGLEYNEEEFMNMYRKKAYKIRKMPLPIIEKTNAPLLLPIDKNSAISWKGSVGAKCYDVERSENKNGPWNKIGYNVSDADQYYFPLFNDNSAVITKEYFYRVRAKNMSGESEFSNTIGPVKCKSNIMIDEMKNLTVMYYHEGEIGIKSNEERKFKEDPNRIEVDKGSKLFYFIPAVITSFNVYSFSKEDLASLKFYLSADGINFEEYQAVRVSYFLGSGDYDYWVPSKYSFTFTESTRNYSYIKIEVEKLNQISRVEIEYLPFSSVCR